MQASRPQFRWIIRRDLIGKVIKKLVRKKGEGAAFFN
jgi:hypothetical protein